MNNWGVKYRLWTGLVIIGVYLLGSGWSHSARSFGHPPGEDSLVIGIIGDQTGAHDLNKAYTTLEEATQQIKRHHPGVVIHVGDFVESAFGISGYSEYLHDFNRGTRAMNSIGVPWFLTTGDHDVNPPGYHPLSPDHSREHWYQDLCDSIGLPVSQHLYYSFDVGNYHFISLDALERFHTDPRWGSIFLNKLPDDQINWLKSDLESHANATGIIVFLHHPQWYVWSNWSSVHNLLRQYPVIAVIAGHFHYDQDDGLIDGIHYLVVGATGGDTMHGDANSGGTPEYGVMNLRGRAITGFTLYQVPSDSVLEFTPRVSTDRMQALRTMLSNLFEDRTLYLAYKGDIEKAAPEGGTVNVGIRYLANPIDLPVHMAVTVSDGKSHQLNVPPVQFTAGERTDYANYSFSGFWKAPSVFWVGKSDLKSNSWMLQDSVDVTIKVTYTDTRKRWIRQEYKFRTKTISTTNSQ